MGRKLNWISVEKTLKDFGVSLFAPAEFARIFATTPVSAQKFLERYTKKGVFARPKKGLYFYPGKLQHEMALANLIYAPSYVSFETALSYYHIIPETVYGITSATTKSTREFKLKEITYSYTTIKKAAFTGYAPTEIYGEITQIAIPEKAVCDYLYLVSLGKKSLNDRLDTRTVNFGKLRGFARLFARKGLDKIIHDLI